MSTGKQQKPFSLGQENGGSTPVDSDHSLPSHAEVPPPMYSSTPERGLGAGGQDERSPLLGGGVPSLSSPRGGALTPAEEAVRRATELRSQRGCGCYQGLRRRWVGFWARLRWWWDGKWWDIKRFFHHYKGHLLAAVVTILLIWGLVLLIIRTSYVCEIPEDAEVTTMEYSFDPADYRELFFHLDEGITGDIFVSQSRDRIERNVTIVITAKGSTPDMLSAISLKTIPSPRSSLLEANIFLEMTSSAIRAALARNCTRVEVDIIFPRRLMKYDLIQLESNYAGNVQVSMGPESVGTAAVDRLEILTKSGSVSVKDLVVSEAMNIVTKGGGGKVKAQVVATKAVRVKAKNNVDLELESYSNTLDVKVDTSRDAEVTMKTPFYGHLWLESSYRPELFATACCFYQTMRDNHSLIGFMSYNGYEPGYLPRIIAKGDSTRLILY